MPLQFLCFGPRFCLDEVKGEEEQEDGDVDGDGDGDVDGDVDGDGDGDVDSYGYGGAWTFLSCCGV